MKQDKKNIYWWVLLVGIAIVLFILLLATVMKKNLQCVSNPLVYGAQEVSEQGGYLSCGCNIYYDGKSAPFIFDDQGVQVEELDDLFMKGGDIEIGKIR